jgi:hypothetical protein
MSLTGNFKGLGQLERNIGQLARVPSRAAASAAERIHGRLQEQFDRGVDPYGHPWAPLRPATIRRGRTSPPLTNTREMRDHELEVKPLPGAGIGITFNPEAPALFHQKGTSRMKARPILPTGTLPKAWNDDLKASSADAVKRTMEGR